MFKLLKWTFIIFIVILFLGSLIPYLISTSKIKNPEKPYPNSDFFDYENTLYHYRLFKPIQIKQKIILIHGFSASTFSFRKNADYLAQQNCLVVAVDMPGFGYSDKSDTANYSDVSKINAIHHLLNKINLNVGDDKPWVVLGHSMGANTTAQFTSAFPEQVQALIWIDGAGISFEKSKFQQLGLYPPLLKWADIVLEKKYLNQESFKELLSSAYGKEADSAAVAGYLKPFKQSGSGSAILRMFANSGSLLLNDSLIAQKPKLIIWGKNDTWIPFSKIQQGLKGNIVLIEDAGHCPMETHADMVNGYINQFLKTLH